MKTAQYINTFIVDELKLSQVAQVGVDLTLNKVNQIVGQGQILADPGKTIHGEYIEIFPEAIEIPRWNLTPGVYSIEFDQGLLALPATISAIIIQRSTIGRNGALIRSSVYDPGFTTTKMGAILYVFVPIIIEQHARVAQIIFIEGDDATLYDGSYQGQKDFK